MRLATILMHDGPRAALVEQGSVLPLALPGGDLTSVRAIAAAGRDGIDHVRAWARTQPASAWCPLPSVELGPAVPDPGAIYAIGLNYRPDSVGPGDPDPGRPARPLVYGKAVSSVAADGAILRWDRATAPNVDAEVELGAVIGSPAFGVTVEDALEHVFGYTIVDDVSARDAWLDGDQWLIGKSLPGFCPVGPWIVTADELPGRPLRLGCSIAGEPIQAGTTAAMRFSIAEIVAYLSRHVRLMPGDVIATGTPPRLATPPGPDRRLRAGDTVVAWIEGIGELRTVVE